MGSNRNKKAHAALPAAPKKTRRKVKAAPVKTKQPLNLGGKYAQRSRKKKATPVTSSESKKEPRDVARQKAIKRQVCSFLSADHNALCPRKHAIGPKATFTGLANQLAVPKSSSLAYGRKIVLHQGNTKIVIMREIVSQGPKQVQIEHEVNCNNPLHDVRRQRGDAEQETEQERQKFVATRAWVRQTRAAMAPPILMKAEHEQDDGSPTFDGAWDDGDFVEVKQEAIERW